MMVQKALLHKLFQRFEGIPFTVRYWDGETEKYGGTGEPRFCIVLNDVLDIREIASDPLVKLGEAYMEKVIDVEGDLQEVLSLAMDHEQALERKDYSQVWQRFFQGQKDTDPKEQVEGVRHHYDLGNDFFSLWQDETMSYSCAYFKSKDDSLYQGQLQKIDHVLKKLQLQEGERLLDIGSGWGWLIIRAAQKYGVQAQGITLSVEQVEKSRERIEKEGLEDQVQVELKDYRDLAQEGKVFDKIVSVGMFEHVGKEYIPSYFSAVHAMLKSGGLSLLHTLTHPQEDPSNPWLEKYIFPWGYIPSLREVVWELPDHSFHLLDLESLRLHYALTTQHWAENLEKVAQEVKEKYGETFFRMWRLFLNGCSVSFRHSGLDVHQLLFSKNLNNALPLTREFMYRESS